MYRVSTVAKIQMSLSSVLIFTTKTKGSRLSSIKSLGPVFSLHNVQVQFFSLHNANFFLIPDFLEYFFLILHQYPRNLHNTQFYDFQISNFLFYLRQCMVNSYASLYFSLFPFIYIGSKFKLEQWKLILYMSII